MNSQKIQKITRKLALAIATVATIAASMTAPSQATTPSRIISARDGRPAIAIFAGSGEAFAIGCPDLDKLWGGMDYQYVTGAEYDKITTSGATRLTGYLGCDPSLYKAYVYPAIREGNTIVLRHFSDNRLYRHTVTPEFFQALKAAPTWLLPTEGEKILAQYPAGKTEFTPDRSSFKFPRPVPPTFQALGIFTRPMSPSKIIVAPGVPQLLVFNGAEAFKIGCLPLRALWDPMPTQKVEKGEYDRTVKLKYLTRDLPCNAPNRVKAYTSSAFSPYAGIVVVDGINAYPVSSSAFIRAIGVTPKNLTDFQGYDFLNQNPDVFKTIPLTTNR